MRRSTHNKASHYAVSSSHCHFVSHRPKYFPQHPIFKQPAYLPPSMWEAKFHTHMKDKAKSLSVYFNLYIFEHLTVRQRMLHRMVASIPWLQSAFNLFVNEILIFYYFSQILEFSHTFKWLISYLCIVILFCITFMKHEYMLSFLSINF